MKHYFFLLAMMLQFIASLGNDFKTVKMNLDLKDFKFSYNENEELEIGYKNSSFFFIENDSLPRLPYFSKMIQIPNNREYIGISVNGETSVIKENVTLAPNPMPFIVGEPYIEPAKKHEFEKKTFPENPIESPEMFYSCGYKILSFSVCPFEYDAATKQLYFRSSMEVSIEMEECEEMSVQGPDNTSEILSGVVEDFVPRETINGFLPYTNSYSDTGYRPIKYLIVTNSELSEAFEPLRDWKTKKGARAEIVTMEEIEQIYPQFDSQLALKTFLDSCYRTHDLEYVLLGGDETVVPVRGCNRILSYLNSNGESERIHDKQLPADLYYACFDSPFDWNFDGDTLIGSSRDRISIIPSIFITRAPLRTTYDVNTFNNKILYYEQTPRVNGWNNNILMCGRKLWEYLDTISDSEAKGIRLYNEAIAPYWNGAMTKFYDNHIDGYNGAYSITPPHLTEQLSQGYSFVEVITHGRPKSWATKTISYTDMDAMNLNNDIPTIITTLACSTNAFDNPEDSGGDPCLSEAFIRNPNNSVVAYLGCSRVNLDIKGDSFGSGMNVEKSYYTNLFSDRFKNKNYGKIVAAAKIDLSAPSACNRWVLLALNPIGDPEMPIYTQTPTQLTNINVLKANGKLYFNMPDTTSTVCVMSKNDNGASLYMAIENHPTDFVVNGINMDVSVTVTQQNKIPYTRDFLVADDAPTSTNPCIVSCSPNPTSGALNISATIPGNTNAEIRIANSMGRVMSVIPFHSSQTLITNISSFPHGSYFVSLYVSNILFDTKTIIKL